MIHVVWEFRVKPEKLREFETHYGTAGTWVALFRKGEGYRESILLHDREAPERYVTVDVWSDSESFRAFRERHAREGGRELSVDRIDSMSMLEKLPLWMKAANSRTLLMRLIDELEQKALVTTPSGPAATRGPGRGSSAPPTSRSGRTSPGCSPASWRRA